MSKFIKKLKEIEEAFKRPGLNEIFDHLEFDTEEFTNRYNNALEAILSLRQFLGSNEKAMYLLSTEFFGENGTNYYDDAIEAFEHGWDDLTSVLDKIEYNLNKKV